MQNLFSRLARGEALVRIVEAHHGSDVHEGLLLVVQGQRLRRVFLPSLKPRNRRTRLCARLRRRALALILADFRVSMPAVRPRLAPTANAASMMNFDISERTLPANPRRRLDNQTKNTLLVESKPREAGKYGGRTVQEALEKCF